MNLRFKSEQLADTLDVHLDVPFDNEAIDIIEDALFQICLETLEKAAKIADNVSNQDYYEGYTYIARDVAHQIRAFAAQETKPQDERKV